MVHIASDVVLFCVFDGGLLLLFYQMIIERSFVNNVHNNIYIYIYIYLFIYLLIGFPKKGFLIDVKDSIRLMQ